MFTNAIILIIFVLVLQPTYRWLEKRYPSVNWGYVVFGAISLFVVVTVATPVANMR